MVNEFNRLVIPVFVCVRSFREAALSVLLEY